MAGFIALLAIIGLGATGCETLSAMFPGLVSPGAASSAAPEQTVYAVGDKGPGGGIVFYDKGNDEDGWRYLEAAPEDVGGTLTWIAPAWYDYRFDQGSGWREIGKGKLSTATILSVDADAPAAKACVDYRGGGKNDWFLPSTEELIAMYKQNSLLNLKARYYWSSTQYYSRGEYAELYNTGENRYGMWDKDKELNVRPIRAFLTSAKGAPSVEPIDQTEKIELFLNPPPPWTFNPPNQSAPIGTWLGGGITYTFNANGTFTYRALAGDNWVSDSKMTWKVNGNKLTLDWTKSTVFSGRVQVYTFEVVGNTLTWLDDVDGINQRFLQTLTRQ